MKKLGKIMALIFAFMLSLSVVSCDTIKDGCVITKVQLTLDFYGADGSVADTAVVNIELYNNNAPKTIKHITSLIKSGYYNGTNISLVGADSVYEGFVQFGGYYYDANGVLTEKEYNKGTIEGEFQYNGFGNQILSAGAGAVVLKHDFYSKDGENEYDTGKATLMLILSGSEDIDKTNFCVIGKMMTDDGATALDSSVSDIDDTERKSLSSFKIIESIKDLRTETVTEVDTVKTTLFYNEVEHRYVLRVVVTQDNGETITSYYHGQEIDEDNKLSDLEVTEFEDLLKTTGYSMEDHFYDWQVLPYRKVIVRTVKIK